VAANQVAVEDFRVPMVCRPLRSMWQAQQICPQHRQWADVYDLCGKLTDDAIGARQIGSIQIEGRLTRSPE
jgi:hypothetical protein